MVLFQQAIPILIMKEKEKQVFQLESEKVKEARFLIKRDALSGRFNDLITLSMPHETSILLREEAKPTTENVRG
tara:strand:- start:341 stop:562 length:222 start_codon:yes stop_codon:yes gene_type:complete